jgi:hypothetical protein
MIATPTAIETPEELKRRMNELLCDLPRPPHAHTRAIALRGTGTVDKAVFDLKPAGTHEDEKTL